MRNKTLRIGSRGSDLALWQSTWVRDQLAHRFGDLTVSIGIIKTTGDRVLDTPLSDIGDKGLFTKELEHALLDGTIDLAVHSLKDLPTELPEGLTIGSITEREDVRDVFIPHPSNPVKTLSGQPEGTKIATGSLRRRSQLLNMYPGLTVVDLRGNLNTRFRKLDESDWGGMILASAGVRRLGLENRVGEYLSLEEMLPAVGQGALAIELRSNDEVTREIVGTLNHLNTMAATLAERSLLRKLEGGCQVPIGAHAHVNQQSQLLSLNALVASLDGTSMVRGKHQGNAERANEIGSELATMLLNAGAGKILEGIRASGVRGREG